MELNIFSSIGSILYASCRLSAQRNAIHDEIMETDSTVRNNIIGSFLLVLLYLSHIL